MHEIGALLRRVRDAIRAPPPAIAPRLLVQPSAPAVPAGARLRRAVSVRVTPDPPEQALLVDLEDLPGGWVLRPRRGGRVVRVCLLGQITYLSENFLLILKMQS